MNARIGVAGCKNTTREFIVGLKRRGIRVTHLVTIDPEMALRNQVAGYMDLRPFAGELGLNCLLAHRYDLKSDQDRELLTALNLDILFVVGWQRLIPDWWLQQLRCGAYGMHGSNKPLPHGRGRSPMNWSLIQGKRMFFTHLFQYKAGVDDGDIAGCQVFDITPFDTCHTLHIKNMLAMIRLCERHLPDILSGRCRLMPQANEEVSYYPKRTREDGMIYWSDSASDIYNLVRAVTHPFHGAITYLQDDPGQEYVLWRVIPFDSHLLWPDARTGEIVEVFHDGSVIVRVGDTSVMVLEFDGPRLTDAHLGLRFGHLGRPRKKWPDLPT